MTSEQLQLDFGERPVTALSIQVRDLRAGDAIPSIGKTVMPPGIWPSRDEGYMMVALRAIASCEVVQWRASERLDIERPNLTVTGVED